MQNLQAVMEVTPNEVRLLNTSKELCEMAEDILIMSRNDLSNATDLVKTIKQRHKEIETERTGLVKPFNDGVKAINARFKLMTDPLETAESGVKSKMLSFQKEEEKRANIEQERLDKIAKEAEEKLKKEMEANGDDIRSMPLPERIPLPIPPIHKPTTYGQTGAVSTVKKVWAFDLVDIQKLAMARPDLIMVDTVKINAEIRGKGGVIDGLNIYEKDVIQVR